MTVPDGYNTVPSFRYLEQIAGLGGIAGNVYFVDSGSGADTNDGLTIETALATLDAAIGKCTANNSDGIFLMPGHAEDVASASAITCDIAGVAIIGIGQGSNRPTFTFKTATTASIVFSAASVKVYNIIGLAGIDSLANPFHVQAADCELDIEWQDASATIEAVRAVLTTAAADRLKLNLKHCGFVAGNACVNAVRLVGVDTADISIDFYGVASTSVVEFHTTACHNIKVNGVIYNSGTTDGSKDIVDTVTGSTWSAQIFDATAGALFSGGSGSALAKDDMSAISDALYGANGIVTWPAATAPGDGVSIAEGIRYIVETLIGTLVNTGGTATLGGILGDLANVTIATWLQKIGTLTNTGGTATLGSALGDLANIDMATRLDSATKKTTLADATTIPNNAQDAAGLLATATGGAVLIEEIIWQRGADNFVGPTNYEFSTDNAAGLTGAAAPNGVAVLAKFNAAKTGILSIDGTTKQIPFVLETGKKLYIHGDDAVTSAGGTTDFYIKYRRLAAGAYLA